jgi:hypothetical protein
VATVYWVGNSINTAQVVTLTVTAIAVSGTLSATINGKTITYTVVSGDTTATAAANWQALLAASTAPPEFAEQNWTVATNVITATAAVPGRPFTLTSAGAGGATVTQATPQASVSQSDVGLAANWNRAGAAALPVNGDDVIIANSTVPLLYNLTALAAVQFNSYRRLQSFEGTIGLPTNNPAGYVEYRPLSFQFAGPVGGTLTLTLGEGPTGGGPGRERYDLLSQRYLVNAVGSGGAQDDFALTILGSNAANVLNLTNMSAGCAFYPGETATVASATLDGGASLSLGSGCTFSGALKIIAGATNLAVAPGSLTLLNGSVASVTALGATFATVSADSSSTVAWISNSTITTLTLSRGSLFDRSQDVRTITITNSTIDADCIVNDPNNTITWTNATTVNGQVTSGPFIFTGPKTVKIA